MYREIKGKSGRLLKGYDVLTEFGAWEAVANYNGEQDAEDKRPGAIVYVRSHTPDELYWGLRGSGNLKVELDIGKSVFEGEARITFEEPTLTLDIGALERQ